MTATWRLIDPIETSGITQMAIDEWLLEQHRLAYGLPCLRFYTWKPAAISLGYHQRDYPDHWHTLKWNGQALDIVRRPSGGRAVLHQGDLTYSLVLSGYGGRRRDIYAQLCQFLIEGWKQLGISLSLGSNKRGYQKTHNCFGSNTVADLVMDNGYKLIGSAQLYRNSCILQHGSIRLMPNPDLVQAVFGSPVTPPPNLVNIHRIDVAGALTVAAENIFDIQFKKKPLSPQEQEQAFVWAQAKYHAP
ncbi:lipoate--protein ligase family protein [Leptolyngbyaceae cyanobacterium CCMR0082]|uniref:Lipoate--protein ligase family protein n=2 Tax=Adonisia turfae TaxID=2950184 RepID=A0A6M0SDV7_9CYAN|nr:biotin/lipoate A/B protein ligase family protein [Adonisia turfae]NEZ60217.1 lipoate--protein ligase family protein [Adonisia turfae CCMR0081]NEZ66243.1 lipoate--protein ligase family protein [Adonisia turfae CCMR0082]